MGGCLRWGVPESGALPRQMADKRRLTGLDELSRIILLKRDPLTAQGAAGNHLSTNWAESSTNWSRGRDFAEIPPSPRRLRMTGFSRWSSRRRSMPWRFSRAIYRQRSSSGLTGRRWWCGPPRSSNPASSRCVVENPLNDAPFDLSQLLRANHLLTKIVNSIILHA